MRDRNRWSPRVRSASAVLAASLSLLPAVAADELSSPAGSRGERPGLLRIGSVYLTPYVRIGTIGLDTNVFYTADERRSDLTASGGPGLELVRPFGRSSRLRLDGGLDYLYFARTESLRQLNGYASSLLQLEGVKTRLVVEERWQRSFFRPGEEVLARVHQETEGTRATVGRVLADRWSVSLFGARSRTRTDQQEYLGTDLGQTLSQDQHSAGGELRLAVTVKTQWVTGGEQTWYRFPRLAARDGRSSLAYGGFRTDSTALIGGEVLAGLRWFRLDSGETRESFYGSLRADWSASPKTKLGVTVSRDMAYSALEVQAETPTNTITTAGVFVDKVLLRNLYFRAGGRASHLVSDGDVEIVAPGDARMTAVRDDWQREVNGELGYQWRGRFRVGVAARYVWRSSQFEMLGIRGLLLGLTAQYTPPQPSFR